MKRSIIVPMCFGILFILNGCVKDDEPIRPKHCDFSGITVTDETGWMIDNDPDDWCVPIPIEPYNVQYFLKPAYPNPATATVTMNFALPYTTWVKMGIISTNCDTIRILTDNKWDNGQHSIQWNRLDSSGVEVEFGVYRCFLIADTFICYGDIELN